MRGGWGYPPLMARTPSPVPVEAEMVANVVEVYVAPGDPVEAGQAVVLLESMKMEIPVLSERAGTVSSVNVDEGDVVQEGDPLITLALS